MKCNKCNLIIQDKNLNELHINNHKRKIDYIQNSDSYKIQKFSSCDKNGIKNFLLVNLKVN